MVTAKELLDRDSTRAYLFRLVGEEGIELLSKFPEGGEFSDEDLAEKTEINLNSVRHTLYTLYGKKLAEYRRIKNSETGWLTYLWKLKPGNIYGTISEEMLEILETLEARAKYEEMNDFYICPVCGVRYTFDEALGCNFICGNCDEKMDHFDNELISDALRKRVDLLKENLNVA
jgi:transcription initiation factor TFIIE subunit alpha